MAAAYAVAPDDIKKSVVSADEKALNVIFRVRGSSLEERAVVVDQIRDSTNPPADIKATPSGLAVVGVGLLKNLESGRVQLTYLAIGFVFLFLAVRLQVDRALAAVAGAGADRGGGGVVDRLRLRPQAQPDDRRGWTTGYSGVHRVHVADPVALRRGAEGEDCHPRRRPT